MRPSAKVTALGWSPDGKYIAAGLANGEVHVRGTAGGDGPSLVLRGHCGKVLTVAWSRSGNVIATGGEDQFLTLWHAKSGERLVSFPFSGAVAKVQWAPQEGRVLVVVGKYVHFMSEMGRTREWRTLQHAYPVSDAQWSPDGGYIAVSAQNGAFTIWDALHTRVALKFDQREVVPHALAWSPDGRLVAMGTEWGEVYVYKAVGGELVNVHRLSNLPIRAISWVFVTEGHYSLEATTGGRIACVDSWRPDCPQSEHAGSVMATALAFAPDGNSLATGFCDVRLQPCCAAPAGVA